MLSMVLLFAVLLGCSSASSGGAGGAAGSGGSGQSGSGGSAQEVIQLRFWGGVPAEAGPQQVVDEWNRTHPNIQVEYVRYVNDDSGNLKLDTALISGQNVDLFASYTKPYLEKRIAAGAALDLSRFNDYDIDDKMGPAAQEWKVDGKYYAMPTKRNMHFVWLNLDALEEAGLPVPTDWTVEDVEEYAKKLQTDTRWGYAIFPLWRDVVPLDGSMAMKGYVKEDGTSNFDEPIFRAALEAHYNMMNVSKVSPPLSLVETTKMDFTAMFLKGELAIYNAGEWVFRDSNNLTNFPRDFKIAFAPLPRITKDQDDFRYLGGLGDAISINAKSKYINEALEFLKWYADGGMMPQAAGGRIPASKDADTAQAMELLLGAARDTYDVPSLERILNSTLPTFQFSLPQEVHDKRRSEIDKYYIGEQSLDDTIANIMAVHNDYLARNAGQ